MPSILLVYYEPRVAGQSTHVLSLARGLENSEYDVTVVVPSHLKTTLTALARTRATVIPMPMSKIRWPARTVTALAGLIRRQRFDVVHVHSQEAGLVARPIARLAGARHIIYTPQTIDIRRANWRRLYILGEQMLGQLTDIIISVNDADQQRLLTWGIPARKVVTIPNGIDQGAFQGPVDVAELRSRLQARGPGPLVLQMGRLSAQKDPSAFVEGAAVILRACPDTQFAMVGEGPLRDALAARIRQLGLEQSIRLAGWQDQGAQLPAAADVVTLTSLWEGTPYALLEAMAWSKPVVATSVNGCSEVVEDGVTGFLVPPGATAAWAERVIALLRDPATATAMGQRGRDVVGARFSLETMTAAIKHLYAQVSQ